ncbi:MAG: aminotransferase class V-fold PLP-dependent enzyme [Actinobacteria bacterium]|nr:aminotransferase class V-fold PLP-dependent enzyme [Actinomycetota bacterium]MCB9389201.1 aminotransferase class V-fold PLP-dependent enzyme [Acidimicrobiia bacterium]
MSPLRPEAAAAMTEAIGLPSADAGRLHADALPVRDVIEAARVQVANLVGANARYVTFVSGFPEAAATWVQPSSGEPDFDVVTSRMERTSVTSQIRGQRFDVDIDRGGRIRLDDATNVLARVAATGRRTRAVFEHTNNETGVRQPVHMLAELSSLYRVPLLVDAAQGIVADDIDLGGLGANAVYVDSALIGGPSGVGALITDRRTRLTPLFSGSAQERGRRAGLEPTVLIAGFGAAADAAVKNRHRESAALQQVALCWDRLVTSTIPDVSIAGVDDVTGMGVSLGRDRPGTGAALLEGCSTNTEPSVERTLAPSVRTIMVDGVVAEGLVIALDQGGVSAHSGSACSAETWQPSPVLDAMGLDSNSSLRVSFGWHTTTAEVEQAVGILSDAVHKMRSLRP